MSHSRTTTASSTAPRLFSFSSELNSSSRIRARCCSTEEWFYGVLRGSTRFYEVLQGSRGGSERLSWFFPRTVPKIRVQAISGLERAAAHTPRLRELVIRKVLLVAAMQ